MCENGGCNDGGLCGNPGFVQGGAYSNLMNTIGVGDPVAFGNGYYGSGDLFSNNTGKKKQQKKAVTKQQSSPFDMSLKPTVVYINKK